MKRDGFKAVLAALLCSSLLASCTSYRARTPITRWEGDSARVELEFRGAALAVHAVGDFNYWNPEADPFIETEEETWLCVLHLPPGRHAYLLVIETETDWSWQLDPANPDRTEDFLGRELSLLMVESDADGDTAAARRQDR